MQLKNEMVLRFWCLLCAIVICKWQHSVAIQFESVKRHIDLTSHKVSATYELLVKNTYPASAHSFMMAFESEKCQQIFHFKPLSNNEPLKWVQHPTTDEHQSNKYCYFEVTLATPIKTNATTNVVINVIFSNSFEPLPESVSQNSPQYFVFRDNLYLDSIYDVVSQKTTIKTGKSKVISFSDHPTFTVQKYGDEIVIGPLTFVEAFSTLPFFVHFSYSKPILMIDRMETTYQISEWGAVSVMNEFWIRNKAAGLKDGCYSRFKDSNHDPHAVYSWRMEIPSNAYNIFYRDALGNISTSSLSRSHGLWTTLTLEPRFPLFGQWATYYYVSYTLPPDNFIFLDAGKKRIIKTDLLINPMENFLASVATTKIILPEGAPVSIVEIENISNISMKFAHTHSYLDFTGRATIEFSILNACAEKDTPLQIGYEFNDKYLLYKPAIIVLSLFVIMVSIQMAVSKIATVSSGLVTSESSDDLLMNNTTSDDDKLNDFIVNLRKLSDTLTNVYVKYMDSISNFKQSKNVAHFKRVKSTLGDEIDSHTNKIKLSFDQILATVSSLPIKSQQQLIKKQSDFDIKNEHRRRSLKQYEELTFKVIEGGMSRNEYVKLSKPMEEDIQRMNKEIGAVSSALF